MTIDFKVCALLVYRFFFVLLLLRQFLTQLTNLLGTVYRQGNVEFTSDGTCILSPVGNRVSCFDLVNNKSFTFTYEHRKNVSCIALNPQANLLISVDEDGRAVLANFIRRTVVHHFNFKEKVRALKFSPDGHYFAVCTGRHIQVWKTPDRNDQVQFAPFVRHRIYTGHSGDVSSITWSADSRFFLTAAKDLTSRVYSLFSEDSSAATTLAGHRDNVIGAFFTANQEIIYTVSKDGALFKWEYVSKKKERDDVDDNDANNSQNSISRSTGWKITAKHYFKQDKVRCASFHPDTNLLVVGFYSGVFGLYDLPDFITLQTLSISQNQIDYVTINKSGEWLAFGAAKLGQLLIWEWQSESYILKQQGHYDAINSLVYSPDGSKIITAADDGKIKVWDSVSGFCMVTFTEHTSGVTALEFARRGNVLFSASLDGSIRAWDLIRYRNFRTFTAPNRIQFASLAVEPSGEIVCAGSLDDFDIHLWSVQTGQLLERLSGHEGPVSSLGFANEGSMLVSGSWDKTVRIWSVFGRSQYSEPLQLQSEVMALAVRPDSKTVAVSSMDGQLSLWDIDQSKQVGVIDGRDDIVGGRHSTDRFKASNSARSKHFTTLCYSADGNNVLAGGNSKYICLYDVNNEVLLKKFTISKNMSLDGTLDKLNSKNMTEAGPMDLIDTTGEASDLEDRIDNTLPGAQRGDASVRKVRPAIRTTCLRYSPTSRSFSASSTEGLLVYSVDDDVLFDPFDLDLDVTVDTALEKLQNKEYLLSLVMAFRLGEQGLIHRVFESIPVGDIEIIAKELPQVYLLKLLRFIGNLAETSNHVEFNLIWIQALVTYHGRFIMNNRHEFVSSLRQLQKSLRLVNKEFNKVAGSNIYFLRFVTGQDEANNSANNNIDSQDEKMDIDERRNEKDAKIEDDEDESGDDDDGWFGPESRTEEFSHAVVNDESDIDD